MQKLDISSHSGKGSNLAIRFLTQEWILSSALENGLDANEYELRYQNIGAIEIDY